MNSHSAEISLLALPLVLLAAAVISVPIARFARLSAIVAYLVAGVVIGPYGLGIFNTPERILTVAELGIVMLLFLIGLELELSRLLAMRRDIFGLGVAQLVLTAAAIAGLAIATGMFNWRAAMVAGLALALSATSIALRILEERGHLVVAHDHEMLHRIETALGTGLLRQRDQTQAVEDPPRDGQHSIVGQVIDVVLERFLRIESVLGERVGAGRGGRPGVHKGRLNDVVFLV